LLNSCSDCSEQNTYFDSALIAAEDRDRIHAAGAVAEIAGIFLDAEGRPVDVVHDRTRTGPPIETLRNGDTVIVAAGRRKAEALKAVMKAELAKTIVIDMTVAEVLGKGARKPSLDAVARTG